MLILAAVSLVFGLGDNGRNVGKDPSLGKAILSCNRMAANLSQANEDTRVALMQTNIFKGDFKVQFQIKHVAPENDGSLTLQGILQVRHPNQKRYRTAKELERIAEVSSRLAEARKVRDEALLIAGENYRVISEPTDLDRTSYVQELRKIRQKYEELQKSLQKELHEVSMDVQMQADKRRAACELVEVSIFIDSKLAQELDMRAELEKKRTSLIVQVDDVEFSRTPEELGAQIIVKRLITTAIRRVKKAA